MKRKHTVTIDSSLCDRCGLCQEDCPFGLIIVGDRGAEVLSQDCLNCGHCVAICPQAAVSMSGYEDAPEELIHGTNPDPETLLALIKGRRSTRQFKRREIAPEIAQKLTEAGRYTPTGMNRQGVSYVILRENIDEYERIAVSWLRRLKPFVGIFVKAFRRMQIDDRFFFRGAPLVIVIKSNDVVDGALAASAIELLARSFGLGALYNGIFPIVSKMSPTLRRKLSAVSRGKVVATLALGYPAVRYHRTAQRESPVIQYD